MGIIEWCWTDYPEPQPPRCAGWLEAVGVQGLAVIALSPLCHPNPTHQLRSDDPSRSDAPGHCADHVCLGLSGRYRPCGAGGRNDVRNCGA